MKIFVIIVLGSAVIYAYKVSQEAKAKKPSANSQVQQTSGFEVHPIFKATVKEFAWERYQASIFKNETSEVLIGAEHSDIEIGRVKFKDQPRNLGCKLNFKTKPYGPIFHLIAKSHHNHVPEDKKDDPYYRADVNIRTPAKVFAVSFLEPEELFNANVITEQCSTAFIGSTKKYGVALTPDYNQSLFFQFRVKAE